VKQADSGLRTGKRFEADAWAFAISAEH